MSFGIIFFKHRLCGIDRVTRQHIALLEHKVGEPHIAIAVRDKRTDGDIDHSFILFL